MRNNETTVAWMVTHLDSPEALQAWRHYIAHNAVLIGKVDNLVSRMQGRLNAMEHMVERYKAVAKGTPSEYIRGMQEGLAISVESEGAWLQQDLAQLKAVQKDLHTILGR